MIPFIGNVQNRQIYKDRKLISVCLGMRGEANQREMQNNS